MANVGRLFSQCLVLPSSFYVYTHRRFEVGNVLTYAYISQNALKLKTWNGKTIWGHLIFCEMCPSESKVTSGND